MKKIYVNLVSIIIFKYLDVQHVILDVKPALIIVQMIVHRVNLHIFMKIINAYSNLAMVIIKLIEQILFPQKLYSFPLHVILIVKAVMVFTLQIVHYV